MDAVLDVDWAAHWRALVRTREAQTGPPETDDWWAARAKQFARQMNAQPDDPVLRFLEPWLRPSATLLDVGAGTGRHTNPLTRRLEWVTAVEPSQGMREYIEPAANLTVIGSTWEDADPAPADLVICIHVLYPVAEVVPFVEKLERLARERVFIWMRDAPVMLPAEVMARPERGREPWLRDCLMVLRQLGVEPEMWLGSGPATAVRYESMEEAVRQSRSHLGLAWDEERGRAWLEANLRADEDGTLTYQASPATTGVLHWKPRA
jgi:SAM-dependent methyltransferase